MNNFDTAPHCKSNTVMGIILIMIGSVLLARNFIPNINIANYWPFLFVGIGAWVLLRVLRSDNDM